MRSITWMINGAVATTAMGLTPSQAETSDCDPPIRVKILEVHQQWQGDQSNVEKPEYRLIDDAKTWAEQWATIHEHMRPTPPAPEIDFQKHAVLAAFQGRRSTGGYSITIAPYETDDEVIAKVTHRSPPPGAITIQVLTTPFHAVVIDKPTKPVRFVESQGKPLRGREAPR